MNNCPLNVARLDMLHSRGPAAANDLSPRKFWSLHGTTHIWNWNWMSSIDSKW